MHDPLIEQLELLSADYPIPDPSWDYAGIWKQVVTLQRCSHALAELLAQTEAASPESDPCGICETARLVQFYLQAIVENATQALGRSHPYLLDHNQSQGTYRVNSGHSTKLPEADRKSDLNE